MQLTRRRKQRTSSSPKLQPLRRKAKKRVAVLSAGPMSTGQRTARKDKPKKSANMVISEHGGSRYGNYLPTVLLVCLSPDWWVDTGSNIHVCADIFLFSSY